MSENIQAKPLRMPGDDARPRILVIDDELEILIIFSEILEVEGFDVVITTDGYKAEEIVDTQNVDAILLDLGMPERDGYELLDVFKEHHPNTPIIVVTGKASADAATSCFKKGAADFLTKPVSPSLINS
jgi:CheY-like chemotaxis protein